MKKMIWLIKRELWEHKDGFVIAPMIVALLLVGVMAAWVFARVVLHSNMGLYINNVEVSISINQLSATQLDAIRSSISGGFSFISFLLFGLNGFVVFFYCLGSLFDERKDRSILFWKSLPTSDTSTVLSKVLTATLVAPLITFAITTVTVIMLLVLGAIALGGSGQSVSPLLTADIALMPVKVMSTLPLQMLWGLITIGWLMMISSVAKSKPFLLAVGIPILSLVLLSVINGSFKVGLPMEDIGNVALRLLISTTPGSWNLFGSGSGDSGSFGAYILQDWTNSTIHGLWQGVVAGAVMIYVAIRMRQRAVEV